MKKRLPSFVAGMLTTALIGTLGLSVLAATGQFTITVDPVNIQVNGATFAPTDTNGNSVPVFALNGTTYAPLRALAEAYGLKVGYDASSNMATVVKAGSTQETVNQSNRPETIYIMLAKLNGKFYEFSSSTGNGSIAACLMPSGEISGVPNMVHTAYILSLLNGGYSIDETNVHNPNLAGTISAFKNQETKQLYYTENTTYEYAGLHEVSVYTETLHVNPSFSATIVNSTSDGLRSATPKDVAIEIPSSKEGYRSYVINISLICQELGLKVPNVYFDDDFDAYVLNLD